MCTKARLYIYKTNATNEKKSSNIKNTLHLKNTPSVLRCNKNTHKCKTHPSPLMYNTKLHFTM